MYKLVAQISGKPTQSTMKEDYIMCPECESRIGLLERYVANNFFMLYKDLIHALKFPRSTELLPPRTEIINMKYVVLEILNLFSYSIFWRVANSSEHYPNYNLPKEINEELRRQLDYHISYRWETLDSQARGVTLQDKYPYDVHVCLSNENQGINWVIARDFRADRPSFIAANELHFYFYDSKSVFNPVHQFSSDLNAPHVKSISFADWYSTLNHIRTSIFSSMNT